MEKKTNKKVLKQEPPPPPLKPQEAETRVSYIRQEILKVEQLQTEGVDYEEIKNRVPEFVRDFPHLFLMVTSKEGYQKETLNTMLLMLDTMSNSVITQHDASIQVGKHLIENYMHSDETKK